MAMVDAVNLSHQLQTFGDDLEQAFATYNRQRALRTGRVQLSSREMGDKVFHAEGAAAAVRNAILRSRDEEEWFFRMKWIYGSNGI
jgi:salicylate hydroxylase